VALFVKYSEVFKFKPPIGTVQVLVGIGKSPNWLQISLRTELSVIVSWSTFFLPTGQPLYGPTTFGHWSRPRLTSQFGVSLQVGYGWPQSGSCRHKSGQPTGQFAAQAPSCTQLQPAGQICVAPQGFSLKQSVPLAAQAP
jgi:hypothetical protein